MTSKRNKVLLGVFILFVISIGILLPLAFLPPIGQRNFKLEILSEFETGGFTFDVVVKDDIAYLSVAKNPGPSELLILDVSDPSNPVELGSYDELGYPDQLAVVEETVFITDRVGPLQVIDVADPSNPEKIGEYAGSEEIYDIEIVDDIAYVADWNQGLNILNISDPTDPQRIGHYGISGAAIHVDIVGDLVYMSDHRSSRTGLVVLNVSDPTDPTQVDSYLPDDELWNPQVFGDYIYCGNHELDDEDLIILDTSDPSSISEVGKFSFGSSVNSVIISDGIGYVAGGQHGLDLYDMTDPTNPSLMITLGGVEAGRNLVVTEDYVYLVCDGCFYIIEISELE